MENRKSYLHVEKGHRLYYETFGNPAGIPVVFLHGGPGVGISDEDKRFFDPKVHYVILFDQRGCGKSEPKGEIKDNTTRLLVDDVLALLDFLKIRQVILFGGSWGATLSLLFAIQHPERVKAMVLRGIFLGDKRSLDYFGNGDIGRFYPEAWERFESIFPESERQRKFAFLNEMLHNDDPETRKKFAFEYVLFGMSTAKKEYDLDALIQAVINMDYESYTKVQLHYVANQFFLTDNYILNNSHILENIPIEIVHGRYDILCPLQFAYELHKKLPRSNLTVPDAGHAPTEPALEKLMIDKLAKFSSPGLY